MVTAVEPVRIVGDAEALFLNLPAIRLALLARLALLIARHSRARWRISFLSFSEAL